SEARGLADALADLRVVTSLAGRTTVPARPAGEVRTGGFGGGAGLAAWVREEQAAAVVDATHPFAVQISRQAVEALPDTPLLRLQRPGWTERPGDRWHRVPTLAAAAELLARLGGRALITTGRQGLDVYEGLPGLVVRTVEPPDRVPGGAQVLLARGPYALVDERRLLLEQAIDVVVTKDSGGASTRAKLDAARELGLQVVLVERPPAPAMETVDSVAAATAWVRDRLR
ncbi:MAG: cobK, partial [Frankiales bacterium]|nr:cobK [Frankiales bacterium]